MAHLTNLGYMIIGARDLAAWESFATDILGLQIGAQSGDTLSLRMDEHRYRFMVEEDPSDDLIAAGWQLDDEEALEAFIHKLKARGIDAARADDKLLAKRCVDALYICDDPNGYRHEFYSGPRLAKGIDAFRSKFLHGSFVTGSLGLGHFVSVSRDLEQSMDFYKNDLGLRLSGYMQPAPDVTIAFFHTATGRFHSLATAQSAAPKVLRHIGLEVTDFHDVGYAIDRALAADVPITSSLGFHPNAETTSFYMQSPSGFEFEIGYGEIVIDDKDWQIKTFTETSSWGHKRNNK